MERQISKAELHEMTTRAVSHTTTAHNTLGWYDAVIVMPDGQHYRISTESSNPIADAYVEEITPDQADRLYRG